ncbi:polycystin-2-like [Drosophila willistoni]|uniref:polycystin-2-like n=1 Tax=Drosophila willistoni TaxID=7260 RepID=UPI001F071B49|nr:polycystin-2-like [Drosophila willistoni]
MPFGKSGSIFFTITVFAILLSMIFIFRLSGISHEAKKFKAIWVMFFLVVLFQFLIGDPIRFAIQAIDGATWPPQQRKFTPDPDASQHNRMDYLKLRLRSLRSQLVITEGHRNEKLNLKYKHIAGEMLVYASYFVLLLCMILVTRDEYLYYNTLDIKTLFLVNQTVSMGMDKLLHLWHVYSFIELSLIRPFNPNFTETGFTGWEHADQVRMLGVVRLRQLRVATRNYGLNEPEFTDILYTTDWKLPYERLHYTDKYWRIYEPWLPMSSHNGLVSYLLLNFVHEGGFLSYPELKGYVALLARSRENSMKVIHYLHNHNWLNYNTSAIFMDFTLYNADANMFSVCTLWAERTPFGLMIPHADIESVKMMENLSQLPVSALVVVFLYFVVVIQLAKNLFLRLWYEPKQIQQVWIKIDLLIFIMNFLVIIVIFLRETLVNSMLKKVEGASKLDFIDFRQPTRLNSLCNIMIGLLICTATIRLWKVLQFASIFQLFTDTLYLAWHSMFHTACVIAILVMAFGIAVVVINGSYCSGFNRLIKSIVACMCFSFGFSSQVNPNDLFYGGTVVGIFLYAILSFVIAVLLINVFVSMLSDYFTTAKLKRDRRLVYRINFLEFLKVECADIINYIASFFCLKRSYKRGNRTVAQNIKRKLDSIDKKNIKQRHEALTNVRGHIDQHQNIDDARLHLKYRRRIERLFTLAAIMQTQMEIFERYFFYDKDGNLLYREETRHSRSFQNLPREYR